jgi:hypothetical protein
MARRKGHGRRAYPPHGPLTEFGYPARRVTDKDNQIHAFGALRDHTNAIGERQWVCACGWTTGWYKTDPALIRAAEIHLQHPSL